jgi:hypothetical protein
MVYVKVFPLGGTPIITLGETPKNHNVLFGVDIGLTMSTGKQLQRSTKTKQKEKLKARCQQGIVA